MDKKKKQCNICEKWKDEETDFQKNGSSKVLSGGKAKQYYNSFCKTCKSEKAKRGKKKEYVRLTKKDRKWYAAQYLFDIWKPSKNILTN